MIEILQLIQWVGSLCGIIGLIILIFRFFKERPILKINLMSTHEIYVDEGNTVFQIDLDIDNIGDKPTTIKEIYIIISDKARKDLWHFIQFEDFEVFHLSPRSSEVLKNEVHLNEIINEDIEIEVQVDHTHGFEVKKSESIFIFDLISDEDNEHY